MKSPIRFIPNIKVVRRVWKEEGILRIELGKYWEIRLTRAFQEDRGFGGYPYNTENKGFTKHIKNGHIIPQWYGFAYHDFDTDTAAYMPIPINLIYAVLRWLKWNILRKIKFDWPRWLMLWEKRIYRLGQLDGYDARMFVHGYTTDEASGYINHLLETYNLYCEEGTYTFPDGNIFYRDPFSKQKEIDTRRMLEGVDPTTNPGWNKYKI